MRSAGEPGSREEDTIRSSVLRYGVRREEEIGARLSNTRYMNSTELIDNTVGNMPAMQIRVIWKKNVAPLEGRAEPQSCRNKSPRKEGTQRAQGRRRRAAVVRGHISGERLPNNWAGGMLGMRLAHAILEQISQIKEERTAAEARRPSDGGTIRRMPRLPRTGIRASSCRHPVGCRKGARCREGHSRDSWAGASGCPSNWPRGSRRMCS